MAWSRYQDMSVTMLVSATVNVMRGALVSVNMTSESLWVAARARGLGPPATIA